MYSVNFIKNYCFILFSWILWILTGILHWLVPALNDIKIVLIFLSVRGQSSILKMRCFHRYIAQLLQVMLVAYLYKFGTVSQLMSLIHLVLLHLTVNLKLISSLKSKFKFCSSVLVLFCLDVLWSFHNVFHKVFNKDYILESCLCLAKAHLWKKCFTDAL